MFDGPFSAKNGREQVQQTMPHSITSSARASQQGNQRRPSPIAQLASFFQSGSLSGTRAAATDPLYHRPRINIVTEPLNENCEVLTIVLPTRVAFAPTFGPQAHNKAT